jgi:AraC-like DNA-binding protein
MIQGGAGRRTTIEDGFAYYVEVPQRASIIEESWAVVAVRCRTLVQGVLPDAATEIYFNLGPQGRRLASADGTVRPEHRAAWVVGPHADTLLVEKEIRDCNVIGVRLQPGTAAAVLGVPAAETTSELIDLDCFWGPEVERIRDRLAHTEPGYRPRVAINAILERFGGRVHHDDIERTRLFARAASSSDSVRIIAADSGLSHRRVIELFDHHIGLKPKTYQRVTRFRRVLEAIDSEDRTGWARIAARNGYFDQAHLIHEFRKLTHLSPVEYAETRSLVGHGFVPKRLAA